MGEDEVCRMDNWPADVVLLDERMPGMSGHEVCRRLRAGGYSGAILIYSAYDTLSDLVLAHEAGADDHVSKAADLQVLQAKIRRAVERVRERRGPPLQWSRARSDRPAFARFLGCSAAQWRQPAAMTSY
jgi:DNA-binding response OmpR family regulator